MKNRRKGFLLIGIGMLFLMFNFTKDFYWLKTHFTIDLIPDPIGYLLMGAGAFILGASAKPYRISALLALPGFLLSLLNLWHYGSNQVVAVLQVLTGIAGIGFFWFYLSGLQKTAQKAGEGVLAGRAGMMRWFYLLFRGISAVCGYLYLTAAPPEPGAGISLCVIAFGILVFAAEAYIFYLTWAGFRKLNSALLQMREENF